ncbi:MAG: Ig-like domain-containing protein [Acidobacteria bacterium]|nr:Ig-like domain-containing protein [Acidobacteriota bacterium]
MLAHRLIRSWRSSTVKLAVLLSCAFVAASCDKMPLVAPTGTAITLVATANALPVNGATDIVAVLIEGALQGGTGTDGGTTAAGAGTPVHNGTVVTFTTTLGRLEPAEAKTTAGRATVRLVADGRSGTATVTAFSGGASQTLEVNIGSAAAERIAVTAEPQSLPGTGGTTTISARVEDAQGNGIAGIAVAFSTSRGSLSQPSAISNAAGIATTSLTTTQEATVTASAGGATAGLTGTVTVTLKPRTTVSVTAPTAAVVGVPASFVVTVGANAIITNVVVSFSDGGSQSLGAITGATQVAHVFRNPGVATVTATATDSEGGTGSASAQVAVAPLQVSLSVSPSTVQVGSLASFTATPSAGAVIERYEWNFNDGRGTVVTGPTAFVSYTTAGTRPVSVRAIPLGGGTAAEATVVINVVN